MSISVDLLQKFNSLKAGKVFYGELAKDGSTHAAVVVTIHKGMVNYYCFTSQELTIKRYKQTDPLDKCKTYRNGSKKYIPRLVKNNIHLLWKK